MASSSRDSLALALVVFVDLFGVGLVLPMMPSIWRELGGDPLQWGTLQSVYSLAQLSCGLTMGRLGDRFGRVVALMVNMLGAALSYSLVGLATSLSGLVISRVIVGLVKATSTISTAIAADSVPVERQEERAGAISRVRAATMAGFLSGQFIGGMVAKFGGHRAPPLLAAGLFIIDALGVWVFCRHRWAAASSSAAAKKSRSSWWQYHAVLSRQVIQVLALKLLFALVTRAVSSMDTLYYQKRFQLEPMELGWLLSFRGGVALLMNAVGVGLVVKLFGQRQVCLASVVFTGIFCAIESTNMLPREVYIIVLAPLRNVVQDVAEVCLMSMLLELIESQHRGLTLGVLDMLNSGVGVVSPLLGGYILNILQPQGHILAAGFAYGLTATVMAVMFAVGVGVPTGLDQKKESKKER